MIDYGKAFAAHYYQTFDSNRAGLLNLYGPDSMLTFETSSVQGQQAITTKLVVIILCACVCMYVYVWFYFYFFDCEPIFFSPPTPVGTPFQDDPARYHHCGCAAELGRRHSRCCSRSTQSIVSNCPSLTPTQTDEDPPHSFTQTFALKDAGGGAYYIFNDVFRLVVHNM